MSVYNFELTNGSGFYGEAGKCVRVSAGAVSNAWDGAKDVLSEDNGIIGFGTRSIKLQSVGGTTLAEIVLREPKDTFDTIPLMSYISGAIINSPKPGVSPSGWRWRLTSRVA